MSEEKKFDPSRLFRARAQLAAIMEEWEEENNSEARDLMESEEMDWLDREKEAATKELAEAEAESLQQLRNSQLIHR